MPLNASALVCTSPAATVTGALAPSIAAGV